MSTEMIQDVLFQEPIGVQLRRGREQEGLSIEQVGQQLRLPIAIVQAMELDDWPRLGAPVYVRSYLGSYLRLVGLPAELAEHAAQTKPAPELVAMGSGSRMHRAFSRSLRNGVYLVMTGVLVIPVFLVARHYQSQSRPEVLTLETNPALVEAQALGLDSTLAQPVQASPPDAAADESPEGMAGVAAAATAADDPSPVMASLAPFPKATPANGGLVMSFRGESWVEVLDAQGERIERGLVEAGAERRYAPGQAVRITLGNSEAVDVSFAGKAVDVSRFRAANVARFTVSSSGEPAPAGN